MNRFTSVALAAVCVVPVLAGCTEIVDGKGVSIFADPFRVAGLPATDGPSGLRDDAAGPTRQAENSNGGPVDKLAREAISDLEEFWAVAYQEPLAGEFAPVDRLLSYDSTVDEGIEWCGGPVYDSPNAAYCGSDNSIAWDREIYMPALRERFGDMANVTTMAHEYGHYLQYSGDLVTDDTAPIVFEQQADCFAGVYMRWVAEGHSKRFRLSTGDGLNSVLATRVAVRDPIYDIQTRSMEVQTDEHGSAFERVSAFQAGFTDGVPACAAIDEDEIDQRRGELPLALQRGESGELPITKESVTDWVGALNQLFSPRQPPNLSFEPSAPCADARTSEPASYCPATNTVAVALPGLQRLGEPQNQDGEMFDLVFGDNSAFSVLTSRYMVAVQKDHGGVSLDNAAAALRTACLTGVATTKFSGTVSAPSGQTFALSAGDLDEAVSGLLTNGLVASDVNGDSVPAGFSRVDAFRMGVLGDEERCFARYP